MNIELKLCYLVVLNFTNSAAYKRGHFLICGAGEDQLDRSCEK
jgi:hypothetical protein